MNDKKIRCFRCRGRKELYKVGTAYSTDDTGGIKVKCPMCLGEGRVLPLEEAAIAVDFGEKLLKEQPIIAKRKK